jgi:hypothetical protein
MSAESNHIDNLLQSTLLLRNCAGDFSFLSAIHQQENSNSNISKQLVQLTESLNKAVAEIFDFINEVKNSDNLERNYFLIKWLRIADDFVALEKLFSAAEFLSEKQKQDAQKLLSFGHKFLCAKCGNLY